MLPLKNEICIPDSSFHERYIHFFNAREREDINKTLTESIKNETVSIQVVRQPRSGLLIRLTSSFFTPALLTSCYGILVTNDYRVNAVDIFTGSLTAPFSGNKYFTGCYSSCTNYSFAVCEFRVKNIHPEIGEFNIKLIRQKLYEATENLKGPAEERRQIYIDKLTRHVLSYTSISSYNNKNSGKFSEINARETGMLIEKQYHPGFLYIFFLLLQCINAPVVSLIYRLVNEKETIELFSYEHKKSGSVMKNALSKISGLSKVLKICFDVISSLVYAPDPVKALKRLHSMVSSLDNHDFCKLEQYMKKNSIRDSIYRIAGSSDFLWEDFIHSNYTSFIELISDVNSCKKLIPSKEIIGCNIEEICRDEKLSFSERYKELNKYKDCMLFLIEINHLMENRPDVGTLATQLTNLANCLIKAFIQLICLELEEKYGHPVDKDNIPVSFCVYGLGKLGGKALGFASDLELFFIYSGDGKTTGSHKIAAYEFYDTLVKKFLSEFKTKTNGIFEPDMRLRPYGKKGNLASTLKDFIHYYSPSGSSHSLERVALFKASFIYGSSELNDRVSGLLADFFSNPDYIKIDELRKARTSHSKTAEKVDSFHMKHDNGALVDLETIVQLLQIKNGYKYKDLVIPEVYKAIPLLKKEAILTDREYASLKKAYYFFRRGVNGLRVLRGMANNLRLKYNTNPDLSPLAKRTGYRRMGYLEESEQLLIDLRWHSSLIRAMGMKFFGESLISEHAVFGIEDFFHRSQIDFMHIEDYFRKKKIRVSSQILSAFNDLFELADDCLHYEYFIVISGDMILQMPDPEVACTRFVLIMKEWQKKSGDMEMWIRQPDHLRLMIKMIANCRSYFFMLLSQPYLLDLFFLTRHEAKKWHDKFIKAELIHLFSSPIKKDELLARLRNLKQKLVFFISVFTLNGTIGITESREIYQSFVLNLIGFYTGFTKKHLKYRPHEKFNPEKPEFAICTPFSRKIKLRPFGIIPVFIIYEDWCVRGCDISSRIEIKEYYSRFLKRICSDLATLTKEGIILKLTPVNNLHNVPNLYAVSEKIQDEQTIQLLSQSSVLTGDNSLLQRLKQAKKHNGNKNSSVDPDDMNPIDRFVSDLNINCIKCPAGSEVSIDCRDHMLCDSLFALEVASGEDLNSMFADNFRDSIKRMDRYFHISRTYEYSMDNLLKKIAISSAGSGVSNGIPQ